MLYVSNNGETCRDQLCQHPECWQSNVRRVREAVRQRNGITIRQDQQVNKQSAEKFDRKKGQALQEMESYSLPTLKIIDMTEDLITPYNSSVDQIVEKEKISHSPMTHHLTRPACQSSFRAQVPHTTPISPSLPEKHANLWKEKHDDYNNVDQVDEKMTRINFHEIYEYNEVCQDWQDTFISTAYLVWCPSKKKRREKERKSSSAVSDKRKGFKNLTEDVLPLPPESGKKKYSTSSKVPTGGQPYSPCRSPMSRMYSVRPGDYFSEGEFIMTLTKEDVPKSLMASKKILEQKPSMARKDEQLQLELEKSSSTKVLVDIAATLATPAENESRPVENQEKYWIQPSQHSNREKPNEKTTRFLKQVSDFGPRKMLPLPSIAIPWGIIPERRRGHCRNSIPHCVDLDVMMEPVLYLPRSVSGSRSRVCTNVGQGKESFEEEQRPRPSMGSVEIRNHLTSAYRLSPKNVGTPAPTPATPCTRGDQLRRLSGLPRSNTKESLSRTRLHEESDTKQGSCALDGVNSKQIPAVLSSRAQNNQAISEVAKSNEGPVESIGNEFSKFSLGKINSETNSSQKNTERQSSGLDKVPDGESAMSDRAVSPSSRTNIPTDIWAELRSGGGFDHRRITPRSNLELRNSDQSRSLLRGYHSSLGLSVYSYPGETDWKPHPPRLPKSFTYMGVYKPTILPQMPAALTVIPVPSATRPSQIIEPRKVKVLSKVRSIRIPPVPRGSPVPNIDIATASCASIVPGGSAKEICSNARSEDPKNFESLNQEQITTSEEASIEREYLITRDILQETGENIPLDCEDKTSGTGQHGLDDIRAVTSETLQDFVNSDKYSIENALHVLQAITCETHKFMDTASNITCTEPVNTCTNSKPEAARTTSEFSLTKGETTSTSVKRERSKDEITSTKNKITYNKNEITSTNNEITCTKDDIACTNDEITSTKDDIAGTNDEITSIKDDIACTNDEITSTKDNIACTNDEITSTKDDIACTNDEITSTKDDIAGTNDEITSTKDDIAGTNDEITSTKDDIAGTNDETTSTKDDIAGTNDEITSTKDDIVGTNNEITSTKDDITCTKDNIAGTNDEISCTKDDIACTNDNIAGTNNEITSTKDIACTKDNIADTNDEITCTQDDIACTNNEITSTKDDITCTNDEITCTKEKITSSKYEITCTEHETTHRAKDDITCSKDESTRLKDDMTLSESKAEGTIDNVTSSMDTGTCNDDEITIDSREINLTASDTIVTTKKDESGENGLKFRADKKNNASNEESADKNGTQLIKNEHIGPGPIDRVVEHKPSFKYSHTKNMQETQKSIVLPGKSVRSIYSEYNFVPTVPSDFELTPLSVESKLLLPIKVDSDLLLLNDDTFMDFSLEDDLGTPDGDTEASGDDIKDTE